MTEPNVIPATPAETRGLGDLLEFLPACGATQHDFAQVLWSELRASEELIFCHNCGEVRPLEVRR